MTAPRILLLQNSVHAPAGVVGERLAAGGADRVLLQPLDGDAVPDTTEGYDGLVVLGGPMNAGDDPRYPNLAAEAALIRRFAGRGLPVLGICLGAQLMARAFGAAVRQNPVPEIGFTAIDALPAAANDPVLGKGPWPPLMHWHYDTFDLPAGATLLASTAACRHQAFRMAPGQYGFQFHLEVTAAIIGDWVRNYRTSIDDGGPPEHVIDDLDRQIASHMAAAADFGRRVADRWLAAVADRRRAA
jgi:GMP synthase (glutamine-hydrolysing)